MIPARHLRAEADNNPANRPHLTGRERERKAHIIGTATTLMARYGRHSVTMGTFAIALHMAPSTIRRHFTDLDSLLAEILMRHLKEVCAAIGAVPHDTPDLHAARRLAYLRATRTACHGHTPRHTLLLRDRHMLPPDLAESIDQFRDQIADLLAGPLGHVALTLLDDPALHALQIEPMLAALATQAAPGRTVSAPLTQSASARPAQAHPILSGTHPLPPETPLWETCRQARAGPH